jgi:hypothetical protein
MAQQSNTEPRGTEKRTQGPRTHEQQQRILHGDENTKGTDAPLPGETLKHANKRYPKPGPGSAYENSTGDRSIQRGANDRGDHHKNRADD